MIQFFQTKMGDKFFNSTFPRLVTALESLVKNQSINKELETRVAILEILIDLPNLSIPGEVNCSDGFHVMIVNWSSDMGGSYKLAFPSDKEALLEPYRVNPSTEEAVAYELVPEALLAKVIVKHGGYANAELVL